MIQLGPLLQRWLHANLKNSKCVEVDLASKHHSTAEVFPLPMPPEGMPSAEHAWLEAAVRSLNWLVSGRFLLADGPASSVQRSLLEELAHSFRGVSALGSQTFDATPIEEYWRSKGVNAYGEEIHTALSFSWQNVEHSLPKREQAGALDALEVATGGVRDFLSHPFKYLKPEISRTWMKCPRVMIRPEHWDEVASRLVERGICDVIPLSEVLHVDQKPILGGLFGVPKGEEVAGIPVFRLIMDLRPINQLFEAIAGDLHTLPMLSQVMPLEVFPD